jgi:MFS family permease
MIRRSVILYFASFLVIGLALSVLGPALTELRERSATGIGGIGVLFVGQSLGYVVGSFAAGRLFDKFDGHRVFAAGLCILGAGLALVPSFDALSGLFGVFVLLGFGGSSIDVGANAMIVWELRDGVGRSMNALHLCFGLGRCRHRCSCTLDCPWRLAQLPLPAFCSLAAHLRYPRRKHPNWLATNTSKQRTDYS